jgi:hypothetical protein
MPSVEVTRKELEELIDAVMLHRCNHDGDADYGMMLTDLHLKLENVLELWIHGGEVELPIPAHMKAMGVDKWTRVYPPHDEGCYE